MSNLLTMKVGVAVFVALALVGALTMFVFGSVQPVKGQAATPSATRSISPMTVVPGGTVTVTIERMNSGSIGRIVETLPSGFTYVSSNFPAGNVNTDNASAPEFNLFDAPASLTYTVTASMTTGDYTFSGTLRAGNPLADYTIGGDDMVTVATEDQMPESSATPRSNKADTAVSLTIVTSADAAISGGRDIEVTLSGFQIPDEIEEDTVIIDGLTSGEFYGHPASIAVSGSKITLSLPTRNAATGERVPDIDPATTRSSSSRAPA